MSETSSISDLPNKAVYKRQSGEMYIKLNSRFHVKTKLCEDQSTWQGDGSCEELNPSEVVETVDRAASTEI